MFRWREQHAGEIRAVGAATAQERASAMQLLLHGEQWQRYRRQCSWQLAGSITVVGGLCFTRPTDIGEKIEFCFLRLHTDRVSHPVEPKSCTAAHWGLDGWAPRGVAHVACFKILV